MSYQLNEFSSYSGQISGEAENSVENGIGNGETSIGEDVEMKASANGDDRDVEMHASANSDDRDVEMHASANSDDKDMLPDGTPNDPIHVDVSPKEDGGVIPE